MLFILCIELSFTVSGGGGGVSGDGDGGSDDAW